MICPISQECTNPSILVTQLSVNLKNLIVKHVHVAFIIPCLYVELDFSSLLLDFNNFLEEGLHRVLSNVLYVILSVFDTPEVFIKKIQNSKCILIIFETKVNFNWVEAEEKWVDVSIVNDLPNFGPGSSVILNDRDLFSLLAGLRPNFLFLFLIFFDILIDE